MILNWTLQLKVWLRYALICFNFELAQLIKLSKKPTGYCFDGSGLQLPHIRILESLKVFQVFGADVQDLQVLKSLSSLCVVVVFEVAGLFRGTQRSVCNVQSIQFVP